MRWSFGVLALPLFLAACGGGSSSSIRTTVPPTGHASLYVTFPPTNPSDPGYSGVQTYLLNNPVVTGGAVFAVQWADIDRGPGASPQYVWTSVDDEITPWIAAGKKASLIVWAVSDTFSNPCTNSGLSGTNNCATPAYVWNDLGSANYTTCTSQGTNQQIPNYLAAAFQADYQAFLRALISQYGTNSNIAYIRIGLGHGGETLPNGGWSNPATACGQAFANWGTTISSWEHYLNTMLNFEASLNYETQLMVAITPMGTPQGEVPDYVASVAVPLKIGIGSQGLEASDTTGPLSNCTADWCDLFAEYTGQVPLELQTLTVSDPTGASATGSLVQLVPFAVQHDATILEILYPDWLLAYDPTWPNYSVYGAAYALALQAAAGQ